MKWYLASRLKHTPKLLQIAELLLAEGHEISSDWIYITENLKPFTQNTQRVHGITENNLQKMLEADILLVFNDLEGKDIFTELGVCMASKALNKKDKKLYIIGNREQTSLMQNHGSIIHFESLKEVFDQEKINYSKFVFPNFE